MSAPAHFMSTARAILDERDVRKDQPPFFIRTTWLFAELEELALPGEIETFIAIKVSRLRGDIAGAGRLVDRIHAASVNLDSVQGHQRRLICGWIRQQIARETM